MWAKYCKPFVITTIIPFILRLIIRFLYYTNKRTWIISEKIKDEAAIYVFWHGELLMQPFSRAKFVHRGPVAMLGSLHRDGALLINTVSHFNLEVIRGSSGRGGVKALIESIKYVKKGGSMAISPDGPRGPRHEVQNGVVMIAQKGDLPIIPLHVIPTKYWRLKSWDQFIIPKPFASLTFIMEDPFKVTDMNMEEAKATIKKKLMKNAL